MKEQVILTTDVQSFENLGMKFRGGYLIDDSYSVYDYDFKKVYYMIHEDKLTAFKVKAISLIGDMYLIQFPTKQIWFNENTLKYKQIFSSKEHYFMYLENRAEPLSINQRHILIDDLHPKFISRRVLPPKCRELKMSYRWDKDLCKPVKVSNRMLCILITDSVIYIPYFLEKDSFHSYEDCLKNKLDGMIVEEFPSDDSFDINITITKNENPIIHTLKFMES